MGQLRFLSKNIKKAAFEQCNYNLPFYVNDTCVLIHLQRTMAKCEEKWVELSQTCEVRSAVVCDSLGRKSGSDSRGKKALFGAVALVLMPSSGKLYYLYSCFHPEYS